MLRNSFLLFHFCFAIPSSPFGQNETTHIIYLFFFSFCSDQNTSSIVNTIRDNVHPRFFTAITAFVNTVRYMARSVYIAYEWNYPELKMSQCLTRHVRREYPELARNINLPNAFKLGHGIFTTLAEYVNEWIYERQNEEEMMENRVGAKVAEVARNPNAVGGYYLPSSYMNVADGSRPFYFSGDRRLVGQVPWVRKRRSLPYSASFGSEVDRRQADDQSYVMTIRKRPVPTPKSETEEVSDAIELEEEDPSFFDLDDMLFGSFGIYTKHMSRYSLPYCSKQYLINAFRRIIPFILGVE